MSRRTRSAQGFTLVEVMVSISILAIGVTGILAMQNTAVIANRRAQEMTQATNIARRWQERLRRDAMQWNSPSQSRTTSDLSTDTRYLCRLVGCSGGGATAEGTWIVPASVGTGTALESAAFDAFGNDVAVGSSAARYCSNIRMRWLVVPSGITQGIIRAEVRVWWYREGGTRNAVYENCGSSAAALAAMGSDVTNIHWVYAATAIGGNQL